MEVQVALLAEQVKTLIERGDERHRQNVLRMDEIRADVKDIKEELKETGRTLTDSQRDVAEHGYRLDSTEEQISRLQTTTGNVVRIADLKFWVPVILACCTACLGIVFWVLRQTGGALKP